MRHITYHIAMDFARRTPIVLAFALLAGCETPKYLCNQKITTNHYVCKEVEICDSNRDAVCRMENKCELVPIEKCFSWAENPS